MGWLAAQGAIMAIGLFIGLVCSVIGLFFGHIILFDSIDDTMLQMVFENDLADTIYRTAHRRKLHKHLAAVTALLHHALDGLQMADKPRHAVEHRFRLRMAVQMTMRMLDGGTIR